MTGRMLARTVHLLVAGAIGIASSPAHDAVAQERPVAAPFFGMNIQTLVYDMPERLPSHLDSIAAAGIESVRFDLAWAAVEVNPPVNGVHRYDWRRFDRIAAELARRGLRWLPIIDYSTRWSASRRGDFRSPPADIGAYADYAGAVAARYGRNGAFWRAHPELPAVPVTDYEIWNEPNYQSTSFPADRYAGAYATARAAIKEADPEARAWVGGLAPGGGAFLIEMLEHRPELADSIDAVAFHPYAVTPAGVLRHVAELRTTMDRLGLVSVPIGITELGWATQGSEPVPKAADGIRAGYYATAVGLLARADCGINAVYPHTWVTRERDPWQAGDWFGIARPEGGLHATGRAYADAVAENARWRAEHWAAGLAICGRRPNVTVSSRRAKGRVIRRRDRRSSARTRVRRGRPRTCQRAIATLERSPLATARIRFIYRDRRRKLRRSVTRTANAAGVARDCVVKPRRSRGPQRWNVRVEVSRTDIAHVASSATRVVVR